MWTEEWSRQTRFGIFRLICKTCTRFDTDRVWTIIISLISLMVYHADRLSVTITEKNPKYGNKDFEKN